MGKRTRNTPGVRAASARKSSADGFPGELPAILSIAGMCIAPPLAGREPRKVVACCACWTPPRAKQPAHTQERDAHSLRRCHSPPLLALPTPKSRTQPRGEYRTWYGAGGWLDIAGPPD